MWLLRTVGPGWQEKAAVLLGPLPPAPRAVPVSIQTGPRLTRQTGPQVLSDLIEGPRTRGWGGCLRAQSSFGGPGDSPLRPVAVLPAFTCADAGTWPGSEPSRSQRPQGQSADCWSRAASQTATQGESSPGWDPDVTLPASPLLPLLPVLPGHTSRPSLRGRWWGRGPGFPSPAPARFLPFGLSLHQL